MNAVPLHGRQRAAEVALGAAVGDGIAHHRRRRGLDTSTVRIVRGTRGRVVASTSGRFRSRAAFPLGDPYAPEVYELTLAPGCFEDARPHGRNTCEHLTVVRGQLVVQTDDRQARLATGDALFFRADRPHSYRNPTSSETVAHLVMTYA